MTGGDRPTALSVRVPLERLLDNCAYLEARMIDMLAGGTYTPSGTITLTGASAILALAGGANIDVNNTASVSIETGAFLRVQGELEVLTGGVIDLQSGGSIVGAAGSLITLDAAEDLTIDDASINFTLQLRPSHITQTVLGTPDWRTMADGALLQHDTGGAAVVLLPIRAVCGDSLNFLLVYVDGSYGAGHGGSPPAPGDRVLAELVSIADDGTVTVIATQEDDVAAVGYDAVHGFSFSGPWLVGSAPLYLRITGETGANAVADSTAIRGVSGSLTARFYRGSSEVL
jgi:hypothetical protein